MLLNGKIMWVLLAIWTWAVGRGHRSQQRRSQNFLVALAIGYGYPKLRGSPGASRSLPEPGAPPA